MSETLNIEDMLVDRWEPCHPHSHWYVGFEGKCFANRIGWVHPGRSETWGLKWRAYNHKIALEESSVEFESTCPIYSETSRNLFKKIQENDLENISFYILDSFGRLKNEYLAKNCKTVSFTKLSEDRHGVDFQAKIKHEGFQEMHRLCAIADDIRFRNRRKVALWQKR